MIAGGVGAGIFGSLLGLGGGILIVPLLTLGFGLPLREAAGVSLVSVIVTSSAAASVYLQRHTANLRLGMTLELFTAIGALAGGLVAFTLSDQVLAGRWPAGTPVRPGLPGTQPGSRDRRRRLRRRCLGRAGRGGRHRQGPGDESRDGGS